MDRYRSCPAVSQSCSLIYFSQTSMVLQENSTAIVSMGNSQTGVILRSTFVVDEPVEQAGFPAIAVPYEDILENIVNMHFH